MMVRRNRADVDRQIFELKEAVAELTLLTQKVGILTEVIAEQLAPTEETTP